MAAKKQKKITCAVCQEECTEVYRDPDIKNLHLLCYSNPRQQIEWRSQLKKAKIKVTTSIADIRDYLG